MKFSYSWLKELAGFKDAPAALAEFLTMRVFEVESVERKGNDSILDIKLLPNRVADASGHTGMAREIAALKETHIKNKISSITEDKIEKTKDILGVKIENPEDCPRYTTRMLTNIRVGPSPAWMRERLEACGLQSINNIVDATNYVMLELGQPLHAFDYEKLGTPDQKQKTIHVRRAKKGERIETLDKKIYDLTPEVLVIADGEQPLAIAGIKGGMASGITEHTCTIVLESANFNPDRTRKASQLLRLKTDASYRFEHGMDPNQTLIALNRAAEIIAGADVAGGIILGGAIDVYPKKIIAPKIIFSASSANALLGTILSRAFYQNAFLRLGCTIAKKGADTLTVTPPTIRRDLALQEDLIEEAGRILGYDKISPRLPDISAQATERNSAHWWEERARDNLAGAGFTESMLSAMTGDKELDLFGITKKGLLELQNPLNPETTYMTPRPLAAYVSSVAENMRNFSSVRIFGIAKSFRVSVDTGNVPGVLEKKELILALGEKGASGQEEFYQLKGAVEQMLESLGIGDHWYDDVGRDPLYHPHRFAEIKIGDEKIGVIGEIHPDILRNIKAKARIAAAEIDMERLTALATSEAEYRPIGKYPAIIRDIAVVVPEHTKTEEILNVIENTGGELLADTDLFDYFQNDALAAEEQKSSAFHLIFQSPNRTLTDAEIDAVITKIITALESKNWEVKK